MAGGSGWMRFEADLYRLFYNYIVIRRLWGRLHVSRGMTGVLNDVRAKSHDPCDFHKPQVVQRQHAIFTSESGEVIVEEIDDALV